MTGISQGWAGFAAPDLDAAQAFYAGLGLTVERDDDMGMLTLKLTADVSIYLKPDHVPATYTVLNLLVDDLETSVDEAVAAGAVFTRYDGFDQDERGITRSTDPTKGPTIAWIADPSGNVIALMED